MRRLRYYIICSEYVYFNFIKFLKKFGIKLFNAKKILDGQRSFGYNIICVLNNASVAQSVVQLIRNQQVACSNHVTSSKPKIPVNKPFAGIPFFAFLLIRRELGC